LETALEMNDDLYQTNTALSEAANKNRWQKNYKYVLIIFLLILFLGGYYFYRKHENKKKALSTLNSKYSTLKARQEKLTIKNLKFDEFLTSLRKELKTITNTSSLSVQKERINELYKNIFLNQSSFLSSEGQSVELNAVNEAFFIELVTDFPQLDNLEVQICYYLYMGFKNKEIAVYTERSIRAIESKRYRIVKKMEIDQKQENLKDFLKRNY